MKATIKDIARLADVSIATVSNVFNNKNHKISASTKERVLSVAKQLNYVHNSIASAMVTRRSNTIGLILPSITNPFFPEVARGVEDYARETGYYVILCNSDNQIEKEIKYLEMLQGKMVDGVIFTSSSLRKEFPSIYSEMQIPMITLDREIEGAKSLKVITVDNHSGALKAVDYMLARGYKSIVHLSGPINSKTAFDRYQGYLDAHRARLMDPPNEHLFEGDYTIEFGENVISMLIKNSIKFDGVFCSNDLMAIGAIKSLNQHNIRIPEQVGVVGFDNINMSTIVTPPLTTVHQPKYDLGRKAAEALVYHMTNHKPKEKHIILKTELIVRSTTR